MFEYLKLLLDCKILAAYGNLIIQGLYIPISNYHACIQIIYSPIYRYFTIRVLKF